MAKQKSRDSQDDENSTPECKRAKVEVKMEGCTPVSTIKQEDEEEDAALEDSVPDSTGSWGEVRSVYYNYYLNYNLS